MRSSFRLVGEYSVLHTAPVYVPSRTGKSPFLLIGDSGCFKFAGIRVILVLVNYYRLSSRYHNFTWRPWQQNPTDESQFRTGDRYLGRAVWENTWDLSSSAPLS